MKTLHSIMANNDITTVLIVVIKSYKPLSFCWHHHNDRISLFKTYLIACGILPLLLIETLLNVP